MNTYESGPQDGRLSELLRRARPSPSLPPRFQEAVWHRIERAETEATASLGTWLEGWLNRVLPPRRVFAGLAAVVLVSSLAGAWTGFVSARDEARARYVASVAPLAVR